MVSRRQAIKAIGGVGIGSLAGCAGAVPGEETDTINASWIYVGPVGEVGWSNQHDKGRQAVQEEFDWVETDYVESVPEEEITEYLGEVVAQNDIVFATSFGYGDAMLQSSQENTDTAFEHCNGIEIGDNMGIYYGKMYQARYLAGVAAGMVTESNKIGFVASFPISHVLREINGFAAGIKHVNPEAEVIVRWISAWFAPTQAREATLALIDEGVDVTAQVTDSPATVTTANENDVWATGSNAPMKEFGGDNYLTSGIWNWGEFYKPAVESVYNEEWEPDFDFPGIETGIVGLDDWGPNVPEDVKTEVEDRKQQLIDGDLTVFQDTKFEGKSRDFLYYEMGSYLENIQGSVPS